LLTKSILHGTFTVKSSCHRKYRRHKRDADQNRTAMKSAQNHSEGKNNYK